MASSIRRHRSWAAVAVRFESLVVVVGLTGEGGLYGARSKLNQAHVHWAVLVGIILGCATESCAIFWIAIFNGVASRIHDGGIRLGDRGRKQ